jgi:tetratricopeptide (TPR) repeat protein
MKAWPDIKHEVLECGRRGELLPLLGSALSQYEPTNLPLGDGLRNAALMGAFPAYPLWDSNGDLELEGKKINHSPEVILQGLAEGLSDRDQLANLYNQMLGLQPNPLHSILAEALRQRKVPAVFTTNQDHCIEDAAQALTPPFDLVPIYDEDDFGRGLFPTLFQFHGAIGGTTPEEAKKRRKSLTFTLNSMGPFLSPGKHAVAAEALRSYRTIFLGYSGSDPDIWYSLDKLLGDTPNARIYWCVRKEPQKQGDHRLRLLSRHPGSITLFKGDIVTILEELSDAWNLPDFGPAGSPTEAGQKVVLQKLQAWVLALTTQERRLAYGWLLVSVGLHSQAAQVLETLVVTEKGQPIHMLASLFAGYARRELSDHHEARKHLRIALRESDGVDEIRYAQAAHKLGESLAAFESVRFWHFWPTIPRLHAGAHWLEAAIAAYEKAKPEDLNARQLGRAGKANAVMNLGQLYRREAAFVPGLRRGLAERARRTIEDALEELRTNEKDLRALPMALAATAADDPHMSLLDKEKAFDAAIEYAEQWNQDDIQIGSAYFAKGRLLATSDPEQSEQCYLKALASFRIAGMRAEIARTELELAFVLVRQADQAIHETQGSREWKFGLRVLGTLKVVLALSSPKSIANAFRTVPSAKHRARRGRP